VTHKVNAEEKLQIRSEGRFEGLDIIFDARDFTELNDAYAIGKKTSYDEGYGTGYSDGYAAKLSSNGNVSVQMVYHHNTTTGGQTVTFTDEEVLNGTRDAWFKDNPVPTYVSTAGGDYTEAHYHNETTYQRCGGRGRNNGPYTVVTCPICGRQGSCDANGNFACNSSIPSGSKRVFDGYTYTVPEGKLIQIVTNVN